MWKFLKMTVEDDAITTEEVLVAVLVVEEAVAVNEEVLAAVDSEATEMRLQEVVDSDQEKKAVFLIEHLVKVVLEEEANQEVLVPQDAKVVFHPTEHQEDPMLLDRKGSQTEHHDDRKVPQILQESVDLEEVNTIC